MRMAVRFVMTFSKFLTPMPNSHDLVQFANQVPIFPPPPPLSSPGAYGKGNWSSSVVSKEGLEGNFKPGSKEDADSILGDKKHSIRINGKTAPTGSATITSSLSSSSSFAATHSLKEKNLMKKQTNDVEKITKRRYQEDDEDEW